MGFTDTFFTLLRAMLGDFDFESMQYSNRVFGPVYFIFFMVLVFFIMLSLFLAILNDAYLNVQEEQRKAGGLSVVSVTRDWLKSKAAVFETHHSDDIVDTLVAKDLKHSQLLTFFDVDRSGELSPAEQIQLIHRL